MWILGITHPYSLNSSAVLLCDGELIAAVEEERFVRIKRAPGLIPYHSIEYVLKKANIKQNDIEKIAVGGIGPQNEKEFFNFKNRVLATSGNPTFIRNFGNSIEKNQALIKFIKKKFQKAEICFVPHHLAHAASTCYVSGFNRSLFFTTDGRGEESSGLLGIFHNDEFEVIKNLRIDESLGNMYGEFTALLGYQRSLDEGKVMGLAPYGKPRESLKDIAKVTDDFNIKINMSKIQSIKITLNGSDPTKDERKDIAATAQYLLEKCALSLVEHLVNISGESKICLAGGTALNIDMNGAILENQLIKEVFIQPASNDAGCALGAAFYTHRVFSDVRIKKMEHAYWGPEYTDDEIKQDIVDSGLKFEELHDTPKQIAELISKDNIIGWMQGRSEFGPRALGCRSLLANPTNYAMWKKVNMIKNREYWRPLAPSILAHKMDDFFVNPKTTSPFMLLKFQVIEEQLSKIPAVVHVDNSARPQTVTKNTNQIYYDLITEFENITGIPLLMNTSLNLRGEPMINNPQDALETLNFSEMDYMCIGNYLIQKN